MWVAQKDIDFSSREYILFLRRINLPHYAPSNLEGHLSYRVACEDSRQCSPDNVVIRLYRCFIDVRVGIDLLENGLHIDCQIRVTVSRRGSMVQHKLKSLLACQSWIVPYLLPHGLKELT